MQGHWKRALKRVGVHSLPEKYHTPYTDSEFKHVARVLLLFLQQNRLSRTGVFHGLCVCMCSWMCANRGFSKNSFKNSFQLCQTPSGPHERSSGLEKKNVISTPPRGSTTKTYHRHTQIQKWNIQKREQSMRTQRDTITKRRSPFKNHHHYSASIERGK